MDGTAEMDLEFWYESDSSVTASDLPRADSLPSLKRRPGTSDFLQLPWDSSENVALATTSGASAPDSTPQEGFLTTESTSEQPKLKNAKNTNETPFKNANVHTSCPLSPETSPSAPSSGGKKKRKKKKKSSFNAANPPDSAAGGDAASSRVSSPEYCGAGLVNGIASPSSIDGAGFVDAVVSLPNGAIGSADRDSNVSPVSFHSLDSNDSAHLLSNPSITFEFNATIPSPSPNVIIDPINSPLPAVTTDVDDVKTKKSNSKSVNKKNKKSTPPPPQSSSADSGVVEAGPAEMAVNAYTCHTPNVVLTSKNSESEVKKIRRQTSTRVEEADVQFQVALPASNADATVERDDESQRRDQQLQRRSSSSSSRVNTDSKALEEGAAVESGKAASEKLVLPANAQREIVSDQEALKVSSHQQQQPSLDVSDGTSSPVAESDAASTPISAPCEDSSVTLSGSSTTLMGICDAVTEEEEYPLIDAVSGDDNDDSKVKEDDDDELNAPRTPSPTPGLLASGSSGAEDAASNSAAPLASPEDLTDISTSCGSSVQSACFEAPKEDPLANGAVVSQSTLVEESAMTPSLPSGVDQDVGDAKEERTPTGPGEDPESMANTQMETLVNAPLPAGVVAGPTALPGGMPVVVHPMQLHSDMVIIDPAMGIPYSMVPPFPLSSVPMHLPDGTDLDLSKPPPIPGNPAMYAPGPYPGTFTVPYAYPFPHIIPYDPTQNLTNVMFTNQDGTMMYAPVIMTPTAPPGMISVQPVPPAQVNGAAQLVAADNNASPALPANGSAAPPATPMILSVPVINSPLPPMPAAGVTPLAAVEGTELPPQTINPEMQRSFSEEATESLKSLLNITSDNSPSSAQQSGAPPSHGYEMAAVHDASDTSQAPNGVLMDQGPADQYDPVRGSKESSVTSNTSGRMRRNKKRRPADYYQKYNASDLSPTDGDEVSSMQGPKPSKESLAARSVSVGSNCSSSSGILGPSTTATSSGTEHTPSSSPEPTHGSQPSNHGLNDRHSESAQVAGNTPTSTVPFTYSDPSLTNPLAVTTTMTAESINDNQETVTVESPDSVINEPLPPFSLPTPPGLSSFPANAAACSIASQENLGENKDSSSISSTTTTTTSTPSSSKSSDSSPSVVAKQCNDVDSVGNEDSTEPTPPLTEVEGADVTSTQSTNQSYQNDAPSFSPSIATHVAVQDSSPSIPPSPSISSSSTQIDVSSYATDSLHPHHAAEGSLLGAISNHNNNIIAKKDPVVTETVALTQASIDPTKEVSSEEDVVAASPAVATAAAATSSSSVDAASSPAVEGPTVISSKSSSQIIESSSSTVVTDAAVSSSLGSTSSIASSSSAATETATSAIAPTATPAPALVAEQPIKSETQQPKPATTENTAAPPTARPVVAKPAATSAWGAPAASGPWGSKKTFAQLFQENNRPAASSPASSPVPRVATASTASPAAKVPPSVQSSSATTVTTPTTTTSSSLTQPPVSRSGSVSKTLTDSSSVSSRASTPGNFDHLPVEERNKHLLAKLGDTLKAFPLNHKPVALQPRGLRNHSNWCYINSTLQALLACPPFLNLVRSLSPVLGPVKESSPTPILDSLAHFVTSFQQARAYTQVNKKNKQTEFNPGSPFEPITIYNMLTIIKSNLSEKGRQQDAEEFLGCVLNGAHEEMESAIQSVSQPPASTVLNGGAGGDAQKIEGKAKHALSNGDVKTPENEEDDGGWEVVPSKRAGNGVTDPSRQAKLSSTAISEIFGGQLRMELKISGKSAKNSTANLQSFFTLPLDIQSDKVSSVQDALERLSMREHVEGYTDTKTKAEVEAWKFTMLEKLPPVLILHLKYFIYDSKGGLQKLSKKVDYPVDLEINKDILSHSIRTKVHNRYKLFAVVYHHGKIATGGHYSTDIYHIGLNGWINFDDEKVVKLPQGRDETFKHVPNRVPYLLYYRRCDLLQ